mgnify:CR=1 FL=1
MNLIKLQDLNILPFKEIRDKKYFKITVENGINEIEEELDLGEIDTNLVNNVIPKPEEFDEPSRRNTHFIRSTYVPVGRRTNFYFGFILRKTMTFEEIGLTPN